MYCLTVIGTMKKEKDFHLELISYYKKGLKYLELFSHIHVFYRGESKGDLKKEIFKVKEINHKTGTLTLYHKDLIEQEAQVFDIKPYFPCEDSVLSSRINSNNKSFFMNIKLSKDEKQEEIFYLNQIGSIHKREKDTYIKINGEVDLTNLEQCTHITFLWWFHKFDNEKYRRCVECNPPYENAKRTGIFASRSPVRPNPIAMSVARIRKLDLEQNKIFINDAECFEDTPCIAILPYDEEKDKRLDVQVPDWLKHWPKYLDDRTDTLIHGEVKSEQFGDGNWMFDMQDEEELEFYDEVTDFDLLNAYEEKQIQKAIRVEGARKNNLKNIDVTIPYQSITAIVGVSGSGKSSLVSNTIYAECRRKMEGLSDYAKTLERPDMSKMTGAIPAVFLSQREIGTNRRSTVGTYSECYDELRRIYAGIGTCHCPECGHAIIPMTEEEIALYLEKQESVLIFNFEKQEIKTGVLRDKISKALSQSDGAFYAKVDDKPFRLFQTTQKCYYCNRILFELTPSDFNYSDVESMCPVCNGLGEKNEVDVSKLIENPDLSILDGASSFWGKLRNFIKQPNANWMKGEVIGLARQMQVDLEKPWKELPEEFRNKALYGTKTEVVFEYSNKKNQRSGTITRPVEGIYHIIERLCLEKESKEAKFYMKKSKCDCCQGERLNARGRMVSIGKLRYPEVAKMTFDEVLNWCRELPSLLGRTKFELIKTSALKLYQIAKSASRLGIEYLELDRSIPCLSRGEAQRLKFLSCMQNELTGILYILDEPSKRLHLKDYERIMNWMEHLKEMGNTIIMVEHNEDMIKSADYLIEIGPLAGDDGGYIVGEGNLNHMINNKKTQIGRYLSKNEKQLIYRRRNIDNLSWLKIDGAKYRNLKNIDVMLPIHGITCIMGVSGSGKSSLLKGVLYEELCRLKDGEVGLSLCEKIANGTVFENIVMVEQSAIGRTSRSVPATYIGIMDMIRRLFARQQKAMEQGLSEAAFSFNQTLGQCPNCHGEGQITPKFMEDIRITCPACKGKRYKKQILEVMYMRKNIAEVLQFSVDEALSFFVDIVEITTPLGILKEVGLGYVKLGQSLGSISGGEASRLKLAKELMTKNKKNTLYLIDEPTTGLHFSDVEKLILLFQKLVDAQNTIVLIEHNKQMIQNCDWLIELGPKAAKEGGEVIRQGRY